MAVHSPTLQRVFKMILHGPGLQQHDQRRIGFQQRTVSELIDTVTLP